MGCVCELATSVVRLVLFVFNFLLVISGIAFISLGVIYKNDADKVQEVTNSNVTVAPIFCIVLGSIIFVISFFGCWGAFTKNTCMLRTYAIFCGIILILEVVVCVLAFRAVDNGDISKDIDTQFSKLVRDYGNQNADKDAVVDNIQKGFKCCGSTGPNDYLGASKDLPDSCCGGLGDKEKCEKGSKLYNDGCVSLLQDALNVIGTVLGWVAIAIGLVLCTGIFFGLCLSCRN